MSPLQQIPGTQEPTAQAEHTRAQGPVGRRMGLLNDACRLHRQLHRGAQGMDGGWMLADAAPGRCCSAAVPSVTVLAAVGARWPP